MPEQSLAPCPWCCVPLTVREGVNAYGRCDTEGCWMHERMLTVPLDDQNQVSQWNRLTSTALSAENDRLTKRVEELEALEPALRMAAERASCMAAEASQQDEGFARRWGQAIVRHPAMFVASATLGERS